MQLELLHNTTILLDNEVADYVFVIDPSVEGGVAYRFKFYEHIKN